jgi:hypothetical protein
MAPPSPPSLLPVALLAISISISHACAFCPVVRQCRSAISGHRIARSTSSRRRPRTSFPSFPPPSPSRSSAVLLLPSNVVVSMSSSWNDFAYDDDEDDDVLPLSSGSSGGRDFVPADENDDPNIKAAAGMALQPPEVDYNGPIIEVPQGEWWRFGRGEK